MRHTSHLIFSLLVLSILAMPGLNAETEPRDVVIGALLPLSGGLSSTGESTEAALEIASEEIIEYLMEIESTMGFGFIVYDTGTDPAMALVQLKKLADSGVKIVIGPMSSAEVAFVKDYADQNDILLISPESTAPSLAIAGDNVLRFALGDTYQAKAVAELMWKDGVRAVVPLQRGDVWGDDLIAATKSNFEQLGGAMLDGIRYSPTEVDFTSELETLSAGVSQAISHYGRTSVAVSLLSFKEAEDILVLAQNDPVLSSVKWYGSDGFALSETLLNNPEAARFAMAVDLLCPLYNGHGNQEFIEQQVRERIGRQPESYAMAAYDAIWVAAISCLMTGSNDNFAILKSSLFEITNFYKGITGDASLDDAGDRKYGDIAFYAIVEEEGSFQWESVARYKSESDWQGWDEDEWGESFPSRPIIIISGWLDSSEQFLNAIEQELENVLNEQVFIVNKYGNEGMDAIHDFEQVPADGYYLLLILDLDAARYAKGQMEANPAVDWIPIFIGNMAVTQIYIRSDDPRFSTWDELVAYAQEHPSLKLATIAAPLSLEGLCSTSLERSFDLSFNSISFDIAPQRYSSLRNGETDLLIEQPGDVKTFLDSGQFKPILTFWDERIKGFEDVPTAQEKGVDFEPLIRMRGVAVPGTTPTDVIEILRNAFQTAFNSEAYQQYLRDFSLDLMPYPADPAAAMREQVELYKQIYQAQDDPNSIIHEWNLIR